MCRRPSEKTTRATTAVVRDDDAIGNSTNTCTNSSTGWSTTTISSFSSTLIVASLLPFLPLQKMFLNAGYTKWFHWVSCLYLIIAQTQSKQQTPINKFKLFLSKFLAVMGMTVTLGWWASMLYDWLVHGRFSEILYLNMPYTDRMVDPTSTNVVVYNDQTLPYLLLSHFLDTLGHPVLAAYYWKINDWNVRQVCTWPILVSAYLLSRIWSLVHAFHNQGGAFSLFYMGYDVYIVPDDDSSLLLGYWAPAYVTEAIAILGCAIYVYYRRDSRAVSSSPSSPPMPSKAQQRPLLLKRCSTSLSDSGDSLSM